jgi:hypothetical protein
MGNDTVDKGKIETLINNYETLQSVYSGMAGREPLGSNYNIEYKNRAEVYELVVVDLKELVRG